MFARLYTTRKVRDIPEITILSLPIGNPVSIPERPMSTVDGELAKVAQDIIDLMDQLVSVSKVIAQRISLQEMDEKSKSTKAKRECARP